MAEKSSARLAENGTAIKEVNKMLYAFLVFYGLLTGYVSGWFFYMACMGSKKDRLRAGIMWGIGIGIISVLAAIGG